jgi:RNA polymerase sigma-70 factor (ECF subfamily)
LYEIHKNSKNIPLANQYHISESQLAEERQWIVAAQENPAHFGKLYNYYYKRIFLFVFKRVADEDTAADVTAQAFLKAMTNIKGYSFQGVPFSAWLYRIASNEVNMFYRSSKSAVTESIDRSQLAEIAEEVEEIFSEEMIGRLTTAMKRLPTDDLQLISLRFFEGLPFKDVADIVGITENNAKVKVYRILEKMKKWMK